MKYSHKKLFIVAIVLFVLVLFVVKSSKAPATSQPSSPTPTSASVGTQSFGASDVDALNQAIQHEFKAEAAYAAAIQKFGNVAPFANIMSAEERHSAAIARVLKLYQQPTPTSAVSKAQVPTTLKAACSAGVLSEQATIAMYQILLKKVKNAQVKEVFTKNSQASLTKHLPAFQKCAQ
jgi:rubrerythrin